jgi:hypothetical protein
MPKDRSEHKMYRRSPGRQYGYDYDPLRSRSGRSQVGESGSSGAAAQSEQWSTRGEVGSRVGGTMSQRPNLRRTRQLLRQNILASKNRQAGGEVEEEEPAEYEYEQPMPTEQRRPLMGKRPQEYISTRELELAGEEREAEDWQELEDIDPDLGYEDPLDVRLGYAEVPPSPPARIPTRTGQRQPMRIPPRRVRPIEPEYDDEEDYDDEDDEPPARRRARKRKVSRRGLLFGLGAVAVGGAAVAAYELAPRLPKLANEVGSNIEHQLQDAFNKGVEQGANAVRQEFVTSLENLEGFTLDGAINAARLTRVAYDSFVSPVIKFGAQITGDFLTTMDRAFITARGWLRNIGQDNSTLAAIQSVLDTWITTVTNMPKQLDAITDTDLDGAQAYLHQLQLKIAAEKAKLPAAQSSTPAAGTTPPAPPAATP